MAKYARLIRNPLICALYQARGPTLKNSSPKTHTHPVHPDSDKTSPAYVLNGGHLSAYLSAGTMFQNADVPNGVGSITHSSIEFGL